MRERKFKRIVVAFLVCVAGSAVLRIVGPILLAVALNVLSLVIPFGVFYLFVEKRWRIKLYKQLETSGLMEGDAVREEEKAKEEPAREWYQTKGWAAIDQMIADLYAEGVYECWIQKDGVCNRRRKKGYSKVGVLERYPGEKAEMIAGFLRDDGISAFVEGRFLHLRWAEE